MKDIKEHKVRTMTFRVDDKTGNIITRRAEEESLNISEYIINTVLLDSITKGDTECLQYVASKLKDKLNRNALKIAGL